MSKCKVVHIYSPKKVEFSQISWSQEPSLYLHGSSLYFVTPTDDTKNHSLYCPWQGTNQIPDAIPIWQQQMSLLFVYKQYNDVIWEKDMPLSIYSNNHQYAWT
jgi:hypothetical protein